MDAVEDLIMDGSIVITRHTVVTGADIFETGTKYIGTWRMLAVAAIQERSNITCMNCRIPIHMGKGLGAA
jgi:hypothetical protein